MDGDKWGKNDQLYRYGRGTLHSSYDLNAADGYTGMLDRKFPKGNWDLTILRPDGGKVYDSWPYSGDRNFFTIKEARDEAKKLLACDRGR